MQYCAERWCREIVEKGRCKKCRALLSRRRKSEPGRAWYSLAVWLRLRSWQLARFPLCASCLLQQMTVAAVDVDHVKPHGGVWALFIDPANLQSLCKVCHARKTRAESGGGSGTPVGG